MLNPEITPPALAITLFGPVHVRVHGLPLPSMRSRKVLWLLTLLILRHDRPVQREWLAGTLWPDMDQSQAFANFRPVLSDLRRALGDQGARLQSPDRLTLVLTLTDAEVDVIAFDAAIKRGKLSDLERAVALYQGPLLEDCTEEWVFQERALREQNCLMALLKLGETALAEGDHVTAVGHYQRAANLDPWSDTARRGWMEALAKGGDSNAALQVYRKYVEILRSDPSAVPDEATTALYQRLRNEARQRASAPKVVVREAAPAPVVSGYLPHALTDLVGREDERSEVAARLRKSRLVTLTGLGGIGKTRLAIAVAAEVVPEYADGVWLVALEALPDGSLVIPQIAEALGLREAPGRTLLKSLIDHLHKKRLLLVLDNCEHLLDACAHVAAQLLRECVGVRILATSRAALGITGETAWGVPALAAPEPEHLPQARSTLLRVLMSYESVQLFVERAQAVQKSFAPTGQNALAVAQICSQLEGIPLAIELAAARLKALTVEQIAQRLDNHLGLLTLGSRIAISRQQTLRAMLDWSYALLSEAERSALRRLSVFAGGCLLEAAEKVCAGESVEEGQVLNLLTSLVDNSLVIFEERGPAAGRYRLLEMVRQYAAESLQANGETDQVKTRHRDWFLELAESAERQLKAADQENWLRRLEREQDNLRAALIWSATEAQGAQAGLRLAGALYRFWNIRGDFNEGRASLERALERDGAQEATVARAKALNGAGDLAQRQGDFASARTLNEESLRIYQALGQNGGIAHALNSLGDTALYQSDFDAAGTLLERSLTLYRELGDKGGIAYALYSLGNVAYYQGDYEAARTRYEQSVTMRRELGDKRGIAYSLINLGTLASDQGDYGAARSLLEESLEICRELGDKGGIAHSLYNLGDVALRQSDYETARALLQESLDLYREERHAYLIHALGALGHVERETGNYVQATHLYRESLRLRREIGDVLLIACSLEDFAGLAGRQGQSVRAVQLLGAAEALGVTLGRTLPVGMAAEYERTVATARADMGAEAFAAAWAEGHAMTWEQAVALALAEGSSEPFAASV